MTRSFSAGMLGGLAAAVLVVLLAVPSVRADAGRLVGGAIANLAAVTGTLAVANGGTGSATLAGAGIHQIVTMSGSGVTCADSGNGSASTLSLDPACPAVDGLVVIPLVNSDADGCVVTVAETSATLGCQVLLELSSSAGGTVTVADVSNILDVDGSWTPSVKDNLVVAYEDLANDAYQELGRNKSWNAANDGAASGLDADLLDAISSAGFCQVAGGAACTMTGQIISSAVAIDVTTGTNEDYTIDPNGSGDINLNAGSDHLILLNDDGGAAAGQVELNGNIMCLESNGSTAIVRLGSNAIIGQTTNFTATQEVASIRDSVSRTSGGTGLWGVYGTGLVLPTEQTCTCASSGNGSPGAGTCDIQAPYISLVNNDADGCVWTMAETTATALAAVGATANLTVTTNAGGVNTFASVTNVWDASNFLLCSTTGLDVGDVMHAFYSDLANDEWILSLCLAI